MGARVLISETWYNLVGVVLDCTELLRAGEVGDEEASAASGALTILRQVFGDKEFTSMDVVKLLPEQKFNGATKTFDEIERADSIAEALGELVGKRLDRPTAHSVGKLFQKRLVGRPAWIDDGHYVATLKKIAGHNANYYRIEVSAPGNCPDPEHVEPAAVENTGRNIPLFPHIPQTEPANDGKAGNEGNDGNVQSPSNDGANITEVDARPPAWRARV